MHSFPLGLAADDEVKQALGDLYNEQLDSENAKVHAVARARSLGLSWETIARELNMSKQAAWERWHHVEPADML